VPSPPPAKSPSTRDAPTRRPPRIERDATSVELRLAIGKDGLGLELARPARLACIEVNELSVALSGVRFPLDVSGGVSRFRHRRGELRKMGVEIGARSLEKWAAPRLRGLLGDGVPDVWIAVRKDGATVALADGLRVLAFEVTVDTHEDDIRLALAQARGSGLPATATGLAMAAVHALLGKAAERQGARFILSNVAEQLARALLPDAGARAPSGANMRWSSVGAADDTWLLLAFAGAIQASPSAHAMRAMEAAAITRDADDARFAGDLVRARALDIAALERAPRHPEVCRRIAEIDWLAGGRSEAALGTLAEADREMPGPPGTLEAELLADAGHTTAAIAAFSRAGDCEPAPALGARAFERAAELTADHLDALLWLDRAVARAPGTARLRWARIARRLGCGRVAEARADVEHAEAIARGARAKYDVWRRAGDAWKKAGLLAEAGALYERALRYLPDDAEALAGLGAALAAEGRAARGAALLERAVEIASRVPGAPVAAMEVELARVLANKIADRPAAIARVRGVAGDSPEALEARALEGRWRAEIGDLAGAALAYARMRDRAAAIAPTERGLAHAAPALLMEAARFEESRGDALAAQRHLAAALRLRPHDAEIAAAYRRVCAAAAQPMAPAARVLGATAEMPVIRERAEIGAPREATLDTASDSSRVEELTRRLQADPANDAVVDELAGALMRLGRSHELLAVLSARLEDAPPERRAALVPKQRAVLERLAREAREQGRPLEADLFTMALAALED
jgi:tetratricopeptide (TPR) repeat protein